MDRRQFIAAGTSITAAALSGCLGYDVVSSNELGRLRTNSSRLQSVRSQLNTSRAELRDLNARLNESQATVSELQSENERFQVRIANQSDEITQLQDEIASHEAQISQYESEVQSYESRIQSLQATLSDRNETLASRNETLADIQETLASRNESLESKNETLDSKNETIDDLRSTISSLESEITTLESRVEGLQSDKQSLQQQLQNTETDHDFTDTEVQQAVSTAKEIRDAAVYVEDTSSGTGYQVDSNGTFATADHLFDGLTVTLDGPWAEAFDSSQFYVTSDESSDDLDLATFRSDDGESASDTIDVWDNTQPDEGDVVVTVGHPYAVGYWVISVGRFEGTRRSGEYNVSLPTQQRSSGSPVMTLDNSFVGMHVATIAANDVEEAPDEPYFDFDDVEIYSILTPGDEIESQLREWNAI